MNTEYYKLEEPARPEHPELQPLHRFLRRSLFPRKEPEWELRYHHPAQRRCRRTPAGRREWDLHADYLARRKELPNSVWCAYHSNSGVIVAGEDIKYALAADPPASILSSCSGNIATYHDKTSPNGDIGMDEVVDSLIHEFSETVTDPDGTAWYTAGGAGAATFATSSTELPSSLRTVRTPTTPSEAGTLGAGNLV